MPTEIQCPAQPLSPSTPAVMEALVDLEPVTDGRLGESSKRRANAIVIIGEYAAVDAGSRLLHPLRQCRYRRI